METKARRVRTWKFRRARSGNEVKLSEQINSLIASIHDQTFDNELNVGQIRVIREHLRYALVAGWESAQH